MCSILPVHTNRRRVLVTVDNAGNPIPADEFRARLAPAPGAAADVGASIRWAVTASPEMTLQLEMHYLPAPLHIVLNLGLDIDNTPVVLLIAEPLAADLFDGTTHAGIVPLFFAPVVDAALLTVCGDPAFAHNMVKELNNLVLHMTHRSAPGNLKYVNSFVKQQYR